MLQALLVGECFGMRSFGTVLGLMQLITQTASGLGPFALGLLHDAFGSYARGVLPLVALAGVGAVLVLRVRPSRSTRRPSRRCATAAAASSTSPPARASSRRPASPR